jgi:hypothetical protein
MWDCDIESYDWFRRFDSVYFADDMFTDFEEAEKEFEDVFMDIKAPKESMIDYETQDVVGVRELSSFVYRYSMTIEHDDEPRVTCNLFQTEPSAFYRLYDGGVWSFPISILLHFIAL